MPPRTDNWDGAERRRYPEATRTVVIDADHWDATNGLLLDAIHKLTEAVKELQQAQATAVATGVGAALTDKELVGRTMTLVGEITTDRAQRAAGRSVLGVLKAFFSKWVVVIVLVMMVAGSYGVGPAKVVARLIWDLEAKP